MSQSDFGTINPNAKSGTDLASDLNGFRDALHTMHSGSTRPTYVAAGMMWIDTTASGAWIVNIYDGSADIKLAVIDTASDKVRLLVDADGDSYLQSGGADDELEVVIASTVVGKFTANGWVPTSAAVTRETLGISGRVLSKSSDYTLVAADRDKQVIGTAALVLSLPAAATAGDGFIFHAKADGGEMTVDPNGAETVDGAGTFAVADGTAATFRCDGSGWHSAAGGGGSADFSSVAEDIVPDADSTRDVGTSAAMFAQGWFDEIGDPNGVTIGTEYLTGAINKAWVAYDQSTPAVHDSFNVTSVTDVSAGVFQPSLTNAFASTSYGVVGMGGEPSASYVVFCSEYNTTVRTASSVQIRTVGWTGASNLGAGAFDAKYSTATFQGELA